MPSRERIFYECLEGECQEHASHTGENNNRVTRAMLSSSIRCNTYSGDNTADQKQFPDSQSTYSSMYSMMLTAQGEASTPVAEGTSPDDRSPPSGVEHYRSEADDYSMAITGLISIMRGVPDSIMNVNNPPVDTNDDSITDELPIVQSSTTG